MNYYVHIEKEDGKGKTLGSAYHGTIHDSDEAINAVSESLDKCGSNLTCYNPFTLSKYGQLCTYIEDTMNSLNEGDEETISFDIKVTIKVGRH